MSIARLGARYRNTNPTQHEVPLRRPRPPAWLLPAGATILVPAPALAAALNLNPDPWIVATNVLLFAALLYPVNRWLIGPMVELLHERERRSSGTAEEARAALEGGSRLRRELEVGLGQARDRAAARRAEILGAGQQEERDVLRRAGEEAKRNVEAVRDSVARELDQARAALRDEAGVLAREAASKILGRAL